MEPAAEPEPAAPEPQIEPAAVSMHGVRLGDPQPGDVISLKDFKDRRLGTAIYNPASQIVARRISRRKQELDKALEACRAFVEDAEQAGEPAGRIPTFITEIEEAAAACDATAASR